MVQFNNDCFVSIQPFKTAWKHHGCVSRSMEWLDVMIPILMRLKREKDERQTMDKKPIFVVDEQTQQQQDNDSESV